MKKIQIDFCRNIWSVIPYFAVYFGFLFHISPYFLDFRQKDRIFAVGNLHI